MSAIDIYKKKRDFKKSSEPEGGPKRKVRKKDLHFVVHKHAASRLHYDLRLEVDSVLKSWAIPKGPSQNPKDHHLAVMVEDHPYEYKDFEGIIPEGNYGAGAVMIWDEGFYRPIGALASKNLSTAFKEGLKAGHLVFGLAGKKLAGEFALIKLKKAAKDDWLLVKARDFYSSDKDILEEDLSARSGLSMEEIKKSSTKLPDIVDIKSSKSKMPHGIKPMLATLVSEPFDNNDWIFEIKWDGFRAITEIENGKVRMYSRNNISFNDRFPEIVNGFVDFLKNAIFDGEIVAIDKRGISHFGSLKDHPRDSMIVYYVFDLIYFDGYDLTKTPLKERRKILENILPKTYSNIRLSDYIKGKGKTFYAAAKRQGLEGVIAKKLSSSYQIGKRSFDWQKIKILMSEDAIICGYTKPSGSRKGFGSLVLGVYKNGELIHIGNVGTGFSEKVIQELMDIMLQIITIKPAFKKLPEEHKDITWVKPKLVCEIKFQEWTEDNFLRQPVFLGLREDKSPEDVKLETR